MVMVCSLPGYWKPPESYLVISVEGCRSLPLQGLLVLSVCETLYHDGHLLYVLVQRLQRRSVVGKAVVSTEIGFDCRGHGDKREVIQLAVSCGSKQPGKMSGRSGVRSDLPESSPQTGTIRARRRGQTAQD
ncbi:hypothetical protein QR685DRAFT_103852 [Neurospora intermedia]|uniref:Uncharacterized protein n=1 Tax=Neurospora intermedia TaxID=5142 RepID=A0ABR3D1X7_NEUIN